MSPSRLRPRTLFPEPDSPTRPSIRPRRISKDTSLTARTMPRLEFKWTDKFRTAITGVLGSKDRLAYTAVGDTVNVASRIEGINKELGTRVLISETTFDGLAGRLPTRRIDAVTIRGRQKPLLALASLQLALMDEVAASDYQVLHQRIDLTPLRKFWRAWRAR